jgi:hypothetical protein
VELRHISGELRPDHSSEKLLTELEVPTCR